jgi:hypothetical protein
LFTPLWSRKPNSGRSYLCSMSRAAG